MNSKIYQFVAIRGSSGRSGTPALCIIWEWNIVLPGCVDCQAVYNLIDSELLAILVSLKKNGMLSWYFICVKMTV